MKKPTSNPSERSRRDFLKTSALKTAGLAFGTGVLAAPAARAKEVANAATPEWRNRQSGMSYRMLGRTGFMISEVVCGGNLMTADKLHLYDRMLDRGLNYLDMAMAYSKGEGEKAIAALLETRGNRDRFFLTTKLSNYNSYVHKVYQERLKELPGEKLSAVEALSQQLMDERGVLKPGYHAKYFGGQENQFQSEYRTIAMRRLGIRAGSKGQFKAKLFELMDESLVRTTAGHYDVLFCHHAATSPESFDDEEMFEGLDSIIAQGKARSLAFSCHNDPARVLKSAIACGKYDAAMVAYNIVNHAALDRVIEEAVAAGMGIVAMKVAKPVVTRNPSNPLPAWRIDKLNTIVPGEGYSIAQKAYLFALQNRNLSAVISDMADEAMIAENLSLAGQKIELMPA